MVWKWKLTLEPSNCSLRYSPLMAVGCFCQLQMKKYCILKVKACWHLTPSLHSSFVAPQAQYYHHNSKLSMPKYRQIGIKAVLKTPLSLRKLFYALCPLLDSKYWSEFGINNTIYVLMIQPIFIAKST